MRTLVIALLVLVAISSIVEAKDVILHLKHKVNLKALQVQGKGLRKETKGSLVYNTLRNEYSVSQAPVILALEEMGLKYRAYWVINAIRVPEATEDQVHRLSLLKEIDWVQDNKALKLLPEQPVVDEDAMPSSELATIWNIQLVNADDVWNLGIRGEGVVLAGADTGYQWDHPSLKSHYRGWNGAAANHNYNWFDGVDFNTGSRCGVNTRVPCDDNGHGTHTMGTMLGNDGAPTLPGWPESAPNAVGMSPASTWISCRNMGAGLGRPSSYIACFEWFIAPTDVFGNNPDPTKAPHVINNSWGCTVSEGCQNVTIIQEAVDATRAAGIVPVVSAGNSGPGCYSIAEPPATYESAYSVAASDSQDRIASFSSRGVVRIDGSNRLKPDITAPGVGIRSAYVGNGYASLSGTSMSGPHVAGLVGLVISANPDLAGQVDEIEAIISSSAKKISATGCGGPAGSPNAVWGHGRIDALAAVQQAMRTSITFREK